MAHLRLNGTLVQPDFDQVCAIAVPESMDRDLFMDPAPLHNHFKGFLYAASVHVPGRLAALGSIFSCRENQRGMAMRGPVFSQCL